MEYYEQGKHEIRGQLTKAGACAPPTQRATAADEVMKQLYALTDRAANLAGMLEERLNTVTRHPEPCPKEDCCTGRILPPLFDDIRSRLGLLANSLDRVQDVVDRLEL